MSTRLEDIPNELFPYLFVYFDVGNLHHSFWGISGRFNTLLHSLRHLSLVIDRNNAFLTDIFSRQITRLKVTTSQAIDLSQFASLFSLELCQANHRQIEQIRADLMPHLTDLIITTPVHISLPLELTEEIFSDGFPFLRHACLSRLDTLTMPSRSQSDSLRSLRMTCANVNVIPQILLACPNLSCLYVVFLGLNCYIPSPSSSTATHPLERFSLEDPYHRLSSATIATLFLFIPNVKYLSLQFSCRTPFIGLLETIVECLAQLNEFECDILEGPYNHIVDIESIQQMHECFQYLQCSEKEAGYRVFSTE